MIRGVVFDLDDTLYLERDFVKSGFLAVAAVVASAVGSQEEEIFSFLWNLFQAGVRRDTFDRLLQAYPEARRSLEIEDLVTFTESTRPTFGYCREQEKSLVYCVRAVCASASFLTALWKARFPR